MQDKAAKESLKVDLSAQQNDPIAIPDERKFASNLYSAKPLTATKVMPEWKQATYNKEQSFRRKTDMMIKQQRELLLVYRFRSELIKAVYTN